MAYDMHVVKTSDFVRLDADGKFDMAQSRKALEGIAKACIVKGIGAALLDVRDARSDLSLAEVYTLACSFREMGFKHEHRVAILHPYHGARAEFFAMCAADKGWQVRAFLEFEEAVEWFAATQPVR